MQDIAWNISVWLMVVLIVVFCTVAAGSRVRAETGVLISGGANIRTVSFWVLLIAAVPITLYTVAELPYAATKGAATGESRTVEAVGSQWSWDLSAEEASVGDVVEFRITSEDVNHGFSIYDPSLRLVAQAQAMPGYVNVLRHTFSEPGTYKILCLEYCGLSHHEMSAEFRVVPK